MFRRLQNLTTSLDSQPWDLQTYSIKNAIEISIFLRFAHRSCWKIQLAIRSQCMGKLFSFQVWYMSDLHYRISAVKTAIEMQKFLASSEFWHSKWRLPGTPKNQVFHYGFLRGSHGKLWCSHGLRTGSPKPVFFGIYGFCSGFGRVFTGFVRVFTVFARVLHGLRHSTTTIPVEIWKRLEKSDSGFKTPNIPFWGVRQSSPKVKHLNRFWHMVGPIFGNSQTVPFSQISKNWL